MSLTDFTGSSDNSDANSDHNNTGLPPGITGFPPGSSFIIQPPGLNRPAQQTHDPEIFIDYNERFQLADPAQFRDQLIEQTLAVLIGKSKPNALLIGSAGVGKTRIVEEIARLIATGSDLIPEQLKQHTIYELPLSSLVAGTGIVGELEARVQEIVDYAGDPKNSVILFIDEIHQLTSSRDSTYTKIAQILKPAMARGDIRVIGATTTQEARSLDDDPAFKRRFTRLIVDELTAEQTLTVLKNVRTGFLAHYRHQISVSDDVLAAIVQIADENALAGSHRPDNALTLLDRAMANRLLEQKRLIQSAIDDDDQATLQALRSIQQVPLTVRRVHDVAKQMLTGNAVKHSADINVLDATLRTSLTGQDTVFDTLVDQIMREELNVFTRSTPIAWLFAGASGVGKTETAKIVADQLTDQEPIVLNMTEYHHSSAIARIIGAPPGYVGSDSNAELPFDSLESNPYRVILLDEFEKADSAVQRLFMQILDEGQLTTSQGKQIDFSKAIIIVTTNAAREELDGKSIGFSAGPKTISHKSLNAALAQHFDTELLGRFSLVVGFNPISEEAYREVVATQYARQRQLVQTNRPRLATLLPAQLPVDEISALAQESFIPTQGARPAARAVRRWIEDQLITAQQQSAQAAGTRTLAADGNQSINSAAESQEV